MTGFVPSGLAVGLASGVGLGGGGSVVDVGDVEGDCAARAEVDCDDAVAAGDVDELACQGAAGAEVLLPGVDVTVLALGLEGLADGDVLRASGGPAGTVGAACPWLLVSARPAGVGADNGVGTCERTVDLVVAGAVGARCELVMAPVATMLIASIVAANAVRTIHRVRRKPDFSIVIRGSGFEGESSARSAS